MDIQPPQPWGVARYGDPCRECRFSWSLTADEAIAYVEAGPDRIAAQLTGSDGRAQHPDLGWNARAYVAHVADNLRVWSDRLGGVLDGGDPHGPAYDPDLLSQARYYNDIPLSTSLWSLRQSVKVWAPTIAAAVSAGVVLHHSTFGPQHSADIVLSNTHDLHHHEVDIARSLAAGEQR